MYGIILINSNESQCKGSYYEEQNCWGVTKIFSYEF